MNACQCCPAGNDNNYHTINSNLNLVQNFCYRPYGNSNTGTYHIEHTLFQTSPTISHNTQWANPDYYLQDSNQHHFYRAITDNTPSPEEVLNSLLRQQNDKYLDLPNTNNMKPHTPLSPMSMQSVDSFENNVGSPPPTTLYYVNDQPIIDGSYYGQEFDLHQQQYQQQEHNYSQPQEYHQHQCQLQHQYQLQQQQQQQQHHFTNEPVVTSPYDTMAIQQDHQRQQQNTNTIPFNSTYQQQVSPPPQTTPRRRANTSPSTTATHQPRKRNTRKRTTPSQLQCTTCFKIFSRPYNLKSHQKTHTKERPYICLRPGCNWTFARPHDLKRHDLLHTGVKPYTCGCGKRFARSDAFKRHQAVDPFCATLKL